MESHLNENSEVEDKYFPEKQSNVIGVLRNRKRENQPLPCVEAAATSHNDQEKQGPKGRERAIKELETRSAHLKKQHEESVIAGPENLDAAQLNHMSKENLLNHFKIEMTKMKRNHEFQLQHMTEDYFNLKRAYLKEKQAKTDRNKYRDVYTTVGTQVTQPLLEEIDAESSNDWVTQEIPEPNGHDAESERTKHPLELPVVSNNHGGSHLKDVLVRVFLITNFILEVPSAVFDQLSSKNHPHYAFIVMIISFLALMSCIAELIYKGKKNKVTWQWRGPRFHCQPIGKPFGNLWEIIGFACAFIQCVLTAINYYFISRHLDGPIKISALPILFAFGLLCSKYFEKPDRNRQVNPNGASASDLVQVRVVP